MMRRGNSWPKAIVPRHGTIIHRDIGYRNELERTTTLKDLPAHHSEFTCHLDTQTAPGQNMPSIEPA
jgi:hypothetical protein